VTGAGDCADELEERIRGTLRVAAVDLPDGAVGTLAAFLRMLARWNQAYNLTSVRDPAEMVTRHLGDSLTALPFVAGDRLLDVGAGAGLPGIPLAIALPACRVTLLDSQIKKARFLRQAIAELRLENAEAVHSRVEDYQPVQPFETIICRAFASLADFVAAASPLLAPGGRLVAMKGRLPQAEIDALPAGWQLLQATAVAVPGLVGERHILVLAPVQDQAAGTSP
jgi:16S rRNA (guanine527-N7)-methyltransferase